MNYGAKSNLAMESRSKDKQMNDKKYLILQITVVALMVIAIAIQLILFSVLNARITSIEQRQDLIEHRLEVLRNDGDRP